MSVVSIAVYKREDYSGTDMWQGMVLGCWTHEGNDKKLQQVGKYSADGNIFNSYN